MGCMIRVKLEVNTAKLKKLVLLAEVSTASRVSTTSRVSTARKVNEARDPVMSSSSTVTYTFVYTDSEPGRVFLGADEEMSNRGDDDIEPSDDDDDDDDTDDEDEEPFEDEDDDEEEEHLAPADSSAIPVVDLVPSVGDTEAFETDESVPTPRSPQTKVPFAQTHLRRARKTVKLECPPMSTNPMEARSTEY
ncbi:hypothetical protein Tco_1262137 [Tanacetum coccineum]